MKKREFDRAAIAFKTTRERGGQLVETIAELTRAYDTEVSRPPLVIGGSGQRVLRLDTRHADIVSLTGTAFDPCGRAMSYLSAREIDQRVALVDAELRARGRAEVRRNVIVLRT
ncbi:MAG: hypothetical protein HKL85_11020 [Acidimicrobiaceae bacterium]|nr:hypothetical protein [Acidimicrobiaceae bacterium]